MTPQEIQAQINTALLDIAQAKSDLALAVKARDDAQARVNTLEAALAALQARLAELQRQLEALQAQPGTLLHTRSSTQGTTLRPDPSASGAQWTWASPGVRRVSPVPPGEYDVDCGGGLVVRISIKPGQTATLDTTVTPPKVGALGVQGQSPPPTGGVIKLPQLDPGVIVPGVLCGLHKADHPDGSSDPWMHPFMVQGERWFHEYLREDWKIIEPVRGRYDWSALDAAVNGAKSRGRTAGLGVTPFQERNDFSSTPDYIPRQNGMLDWNSETYVQGQIDLHLAAGARYAGNPYVEWWDARGWGAYGENNNYPNVNPPMTFANKKRILDAMFQAFPASSPVILLAMTDDAEATDYMVRRATELGMRWKVGKRRDSYSNKSGPKPWGFNWYDEDNRPVEVVEQWKHAPFLVESWGPFNNFGDQDWAKALLQSQQFHISAYKDQNHGHKYAEWVGESRDLWERVLCTQAGYRLTALELSLPASVKAGEALPLTLKWQNAGNAPLYRDYKVQLLYVLPNGSTQVAAVSGVNLRALMPGDTLSVTDPLPTAGLAAGTYSLRLKAVDAAGIRKPLEFALAGRLPDGSYPLGGVAIA
jgi:hypothetical protein